MVVVYGEALHSYDLGADHPLQPSRHELTIALLRALGWLDDPQVSIEEPRTASVTELLTVHTYPYVQAVQYAQDMARGQKPHRDLALYGLDTGDNPLIPDIHDASAMLTGATIQGMTAILEGRAVHSYAPAGGMHHAMRDHAWGFCIYNDGAAAIAAALAQGERVAYVDLDAHHGDGVQAAFYDDPRALTISIHESGEYLFPGTGGVEQTGRDQGVGTCINIPLPPLAGDEAILPAVERIVLPAVRAFTPDILVTQTGCDTHHDDPLTHLQATMALYPVLAEKLHGLAHEVCDGRWLIVGGGGYDPADVTPRAWTAFVGTVLGRDTGHVRLPADWREASREAGGDPPAGLLDDPGPSAEPVGAEGISELLERVEATALVELRARHGGPLGGPDGGGRP